MRSLTNSKKLFLAKRIFISLVSILLIINMIHAQHVGKMKFLEEKDLTFLKYLTRDVLDSSRIYPNQTVIKQFGPNNTGNTLIRPGGRKSYPSFWIRDYAMSLGKWIDFVSGAKTHAGTNGGNSM
jgi:hypothetical protein